MTLQAVTPGDRGWRTAERLRLVRFAEGSLLPSGGFAWLDDRGVPDPSEPLHLWIHGRMTHVFGLESIHAGSARALDLAAGGIDALVDLFEDHRNGGWYQAVDVAGSPVDATKASYGHAFVVLAAATGVAAGIPAAEPLLRRSLDVLMTRFWEPAVGCVRERFLGADWTDEEPYRGVNANMHTVEALLTAAAATGDVSLAQHAERIASSLMNVQARAVGWRVPEHFDSAWGPLPEFNADNRGDHFRPYGLTIGHWLEWARLLVAIEAAVPNPQPWLLEGATNLFDNAVHVGWPTPDSIGCPYTVDWDGRPIVDARLFWPMAEFVLAADALARRTGNALATTMGPRIWADIDRSFLDREQGAWHSELDAAGAPASTIWSGKPDVYHAYQACLFPDLPLGLGRAGAG